MRFGVDLGGTKTEVVALADDGAEVYRHRVPTDTSSYDGVVGTVAGLVRGAEAAVGRSGTVGVGIPGTVSARTGLVKNANTTVLNGRPLDRDLSAALGRQVRVTNDANCLAASEAADGAGAGFDVVFAAILGTGCGAGVAVGGRPWAGANGAAGEWGHNPLPWPTADEFPGPACWCGKAGCVERWLSGPGFAADFARSGGAALDGPRIVAAARSGDPLAAAALDRYVDRLARALAHVVNVLDPGVIVLGGGMSNVDELYDRVPQLLPRYVFGGEADAPVVRSRHGDSSGVRGAAWLWPAAASQS